MTKGWYSGELVYGSFILKMNEIDDRYLMYLLKSRGFPQEFYPDKKPLEAKAKKDYGKGEP